MSIANKFSPAGRSRTVCHAALAMLLFCQLGSAAAQEFVGIVHARHNLGLSVGVPGVVARVHVEPGARVEANQRLVTLDDKLQATDVERRRVILEDQAELKGSAERVRIIQPMLEDTRKLLGAKGSVSRDEAARVELDYVAASSRLAQLEAQKARERLELALAEQERGQRYLLAPVAGVVTRIDIDLGEWAKAGEAVLQLVDASVCHVRVHVPYAAARGLKHGTQVPISFEAGSGLPPVTGSVSFISPVVDVASGTVALRLTFSNPRGLVPPGIKGTITLGGAAKSR